jgi:thiamine-monophosphate kinase
MPPRLGEADLIARYFAPLAGPAGLGLRDDAALSDRALDPLKVVESLKTRGA